MKNQSNVTVGIPFYGGSNPVHLKEAIDSVLNQSVKAETIHLIQNGPIDQELKALVDSILEVNGNMVLLAIGEANLPAALNESIRACTTKFYARMDADDISHTERLKLQLDYFHKHPDVMILGGFAIEFKSGQDPNQGRLKRMPTTYPEMKRWFHYRNPFVHASVMFNARVFRHLIGYDETFLTDQDLELWARVFKSKIKIANISNPILYFRTDNMIKNRSKPGAVFRQAKARYSYNTLNPILNIFKAGALLFRLSPARVKHFGYRRLRK
ncbi:MAG: glycosyltransferase [FCB group bacterium]|nr:glycosyltransferase [FCB group bacterium]MBL7028472.1 glycosyltransferase [Candidatus Neomarinimicrobiota bacterium]MBL7121536.1 glycosyltransferase [Candidatus Neomarinimicrobiota bacterium]